MQQRGAPGAPEALMLGKYEDHPVLIQAVYELPRMQGGQTTSPSEKNSAHQPRVSLDRLQRPVRLWERKVYDRQVFLLWMSCCDLCDDSSITPVWRQEDICHTQSVAGREVLLVLQFPKLGASI